jgi:diguanylate cyclase (GGDEF)-like protein/PAS domain S-box-containing protein
MKISQAVLQSYIRKIPRYFVIALIFSSLFSINSVFASVETNYEPIKIGILAYRPKAETLARWKPLESYFNKKIPQRKFNIETFTLSDLSNAVATRQIDFVLTNPGHYIQLKEQYNLSSPLASLIKQTKQHTLSAFAGVIFTLATRSDITQLKDLQNQRIAATKTVSLGGYQMQSFALYQAGLPLPKPEQLIITGMPHDNVVDAVLNGQADVGFIRTGVLEALQQERNLNLSLFKIINKQNIPSFPYLLSTRLYPEWPIAALPHTNSELAAHFTAALLLFHDHDEKINGVKGFNIPMDYSPVENFLRTLRAPPFDTAPGFTLLDIWQRYKLAIITATLSLLFILVLSLYLLIFNKRIIQQRQQIAEKSEQQGALLEALAEGVYGLDNQGRCTFINPAALKLLGYIEGEILGNHAATLFHRHRFHKCPAMETLLDGKTRHAEEVFARKDDRLITVAVNIAAIHLSGVNLGAVVAFRDITQEKQITDRNKMLVTALEASQTSIVITDIHANIEWVNPAFEKLSGYQSTEVIGHKPPELIKTGKQGSHFYKALWDTILSGTPWHGEIINHRKDGSLYDEELNISPVIDEKGKIQHFIVSKNDISERKQIERRIKHLAEHDILTGLPNRALLSDRLEQALHVAKRNKEHLGLIFLDLDKFKPINDDYGHAIGDLLLQEVALRITDCIRESDTVARIGGDEFIILLPTIESQNDALMVAEKIRYVLNLPFDCQEHSLSIAASLGVASYPEHGQEQISLVKSADIAMYYAKELGRNNVQIFTQKMLEDSANQKA